MAAVQAEDVRASLLFVHVEPDQVRAAPIKILGKMRQCQVKTEKTESMLPDVIEVCYVFFTKKGQPNLTLPNLDKPNLTSPHLT